MGAARRLRRLVFAPRLVAAAHARFGKHGILFQGLARNGKFGVIGCTRRPQSQFPVRLRRFLAGGRLHSASTSTRRRRTVSVSASTCLPRASDLLAGRGGLGLWRGDARRRRRLLAAQGVLGRQLRPQQLDDHVLEQPDLRFRLGEARAQGSRVGTRVVEVNLAPGRCPSRAVARSSMASSRSAIASAWASLASPGLSSAACPTDPIRLAELPEQQCGQRHWPTLADIARHVGPPCFVPRPGRTLG